MSVGLDSSARPIDHWLWPLLHEHAPLRPTALCPNLRAFHAEDELPLWLAIEARAGRKVDAPFYAVAWPGAQALARALQDGLVETAGRHVLDLGCGNGLAAIAAAKSGIRRVTAVDVDPLALSACRAMADAHSVALRTVCAGLPLGASERETAAAFVRSGLFDDVDVLLVGDLVYEPALGRALRHTLAAIAAYWPKIRTLVADSGRPHFAEMVREAWPLWPHTKHAVPVPVGVEGSSQREVRVYEAGKAPTRGA